MKQHKKAEIGFWLLPDFWGTGIMSEAIRLVCDYGFSQLGLHRIEAFVETKNINSKNIMEKMQFTNEGTMKDAEIKNAEFISLDLYAKLNTRP
jgi:ribosomal-protein-alanine N-acetyltransferase